MDKKVDKINYEEKKFTSILKKHLANRPSGQTIEQITVATGLPLDWIEYGLRQLMNDFPCRVEFNSNKALVYIFDFSLAGSTRKYQAFFQRFAYFILILPLWFFSAIYIFLMVFSLPMVMMTRYPFRYLFYILIFILALLSYPIGYFFPKFVEKIDSHLTDTMNYDKQSKEMDIILDLIFYIYSDSWQSFKKIWQSLQKDKLKIEKILLDFISQNQGKITALEIIQITGWNLPKAQTQATQLVANYGGKIVVNEEGVIIYEFEQLSLSADNQMFMSQDYFLPYVKLHNSELKFLDFIQVMWPFYLITIGVPGLLLFTFRLRKLEENYIFWFPFLIIIAPYVLIFIGIILHKIWIFWQNRKIQFTNQTFQIQLDIIDLLPKQVISNLFSPFYAEKIWLSAFHNLGGVATIDANGQQSFQFEQLELEKKWQSKEKRILPKLAIFSENFLNNLNNWSLGKGQDREIAIQNGQLIFEHKRTVDAWYISKAVDWDTHHDFVIESSIHFLEGFEDNGYGLIWGRKNNENEFNFLVSPSGMYIIDYQCNGKNIKWQKWTESDAINQGRAHNILKIEKIKQTLNFYINDKQVFSHPFVKFMGSGIGFILNRNQKIAADYLYVWRI